MITVGQAVGNYRVTAKLGEGGMGVVYLAEHPVIGRRVALKAINPELSRNPEVLSRFVTEAKAVNQIGNEHIVDISDFGTTPEGEFYFVMEYLQGESLAERIRRERRLPAERALAIGAQVADALAASHDHGIIHRDLKPENIFLITRGGNTEFVKVLDFGLAKLTQVDEKVSHKTRTGSVMGTPFYMSPEQCEGRSAVDYRSDIYSLGVILFEMLTGVVPFGGDGYGEIIVKHITQPAPSVRERNPGLSVAHEAIVARALSKPRERRFQTMSEFRAAMLAPEAYLHEFGPAEVGAAGSFAGAPVPVLPDGRTPSPAPVTTSIDPPRVMVPTPTAVLPTTFRNGAGELMGEQWSEDDLPRRSRKPWVVGALVVLGVGGALLLARTRAPSSAPTVKPVPPMSEPMRSEVTLRFDSDPAGATVTRSDTHQILGVTPVAVKIAYSRTAVPFTIDKAGYEAKRLSVVPDMSARVAPTLVAAAAPSHEARPDRTETPERPEREGHESRPERPERKPPGESRSANEARPASVSRRPSRPARPSRTVPDEDAVLAPSF